MRILLILRGSAGCGKSTWIKEHGLEQYALSADNIRLMCQNPVMNVNGGISISQENDSVVWNMLFQMLEIRMQRGDFTVIDATNSKTSEMSRYKQLCETYRYRIFCVDMTDVPIEETKRRNAERETLKVVPEAVIDKMYSRFETQKIPSGIPVIRPEELDKIWLKKIDLSAYKKIHHIGDIHGCNTVLQQYFTENGGIKEDEFYIFIGDYIDRGIENVEVLQFLLSIKDRKNVLLLEGNHERWLWYWANDEIGRSKEFETVTKPKLEEAGISKKEIRQFYRKLGQCAYYQYDDKVFFVSHAGISTLPENLSLVATEQMIKGVGRYDDHEVIADTWFDTTPDNCYQIHGHRNTKLLPTETNDRVFNLEGKVEFGGNLRVVQVDHEGIYTIEIKNDVYREVEEVIDADANITEVPELINALRKNKYIQEKQFGNVSSFNFTKNAFFDKIWNAQTVKARGLYIDTVEERIVARAYNKFFNINERPETKMEALSRNLVFPVTAYVKENGYLGIVSEFEDELFVTTKSNPNGNFSVWLREMLERKISKENLEKMKQFAKENNVSFVFECVDMKNDPHIIDYGVDELFLLDIIFNEIEFKKYSYEDMCEIAKDFGIEPKEKAVVLQNWQEFFDWNRMVLEEDYEFKGRKIEGFVIEDANGFMTKLKLTYYNFWKHMRSVAHETLRHGYIKKTSSLSNSLANAFYGFVKNLYESREANKLEDNKLDEKNINEKNLEELPKDICTLRKMFQEQYKN